MMNGPGGFRQKLIARAAIHIPKKHLWHEVINDRYQKCAYLSEAGQFIIIFHHASKRSIHLLRMLHTSKKVVIHLTAFS